MGKKKSGPPKVSYGVRVSAHVFSAVAQIGKEKTWTESLTTAQLLEWTVKQLERAGSYDDLIQINVPEKRGRKVG